VVTRYASRMGIHLPRVVLPVFAGMLRLMLLVGSLAGKVADTTRGSRAPKRRNARRIRRSPLVPAAFLEGATIARCSSTSMVFDWLTRTQTLAENAAK
jgi:hypothetical protein